MKPFRKLVGCFFLPKREHTLFGVGSVFCLTLYLGFLMHKFLLNRKIVLVNLYAFLRSSKYFLSFIFFFDNKTCLEGESIGFFGDKTRCF